MRSVEEWCDLHGLTPAERDVLFLAATDVPRNEIASRRGVKPSTLKKQAQSIVQKTGSRSLDHAALRMLIEELRLATDALEDDDDNVG
jgi:DNA-binding CsgD family transcriptional regulator